MKNKQTHKQTKTTEKLLVHQVSKGQNPSTRPQIHYMYPWAIRQIFAVSRNERKDPKDMLHYTIN